MSMLDEVYPLQEKSAEIVLVYVGVATRRRSAPVVPWKDIVPKISPVPKNTIVFEYRYTVDIKSFFDQLLDHGTSLFPELFENQWQTIRFSKTRAPSVYLIGERSGGLIIKEAYSRTLERRLKWSHFLIKIRGIFLIAVPHVEQSEHRDRLLIACQTKGLTLKGDVLDLTTLLQIRLSAKRFKRAISRKEEEAIRVVSVYGNAPSPSLFERIVGSRSINIPAETVHIGDLRLESALDIGFSMKAPWTSTSTVLLSKLLAEIETSRSKEVQTPLISPLDSHIQSSSTNIPLRPGSIGQLPSPHSSGSSSQKDSFTMLTPPHSHRGSSPSISVNSAQSSIPRWIRAQLPFQYPEYFADRDKYFTGRAKELDIIHQALRPSQVGDKCCEKLQTVFISGIGGMGKTELAYQYAARYRDTYDVILIIKGDIKLRLLDAYRTIAFRIGLFSEPENPGPEECRDSLKAWFKRPQHLLVGEAPNRGESTVLDDHMTKWLLLIDNVEHWSDINPCWPDKGRGSVLITSRKPSLLPQLGNAIGYQHLELRSLSVEDGGNLLRYHAGYEGDNSTIVQQSAQDLATRLDGLPLALTQIGAYIKICKKSIPTFLKTRPRDSDLYTAYLDTEEVRDYDHNLASVWALESLLEPSSSEQAFTLLCILSLLDPEGIQEVLFKPEQLSEHILDFPLSGPDFDHFCKPLLDASLVERKRNEDLTIHRMVQKVVRAKLTQTPILLDQVLRFTLSRIASCWPYHYRVYKIGTSGEANRWDQCSALIPHILTFSHAYAEFSEKHYRATLLTDLAELQYEAALYHIERSQPEEAIELLNLAESVCKHTESQVDLTENQLRIYRGRIGVAYILRNKNDYFHYAEQEFEGEKMRYQNDQSNPTRLAVAHVHMGIAYNFHSLHEDAKRILEESLVIRTSIPGIKRDALFSPLYQLAHAYIGLQLFKEAAETLAIAIADRVNLSTASVRTGVLQYTLGDVMVLQHRDADAFSLHTQAHASFERVAGPANPGTLHSKYKMAIHLVRIHSHRTAREHLNAILYHYRLIGYLRPYICRTAFLYARSLLAEGHDAVEMLNEAVEIFNEFASPEKRTAESLTEDDANSLVSFDYL
ncbi:hypothetical protein T440DRAFT_468411 [Plenodomus tracheiphilus IPT5]|uniref:DUF7779 domain-containing protein n=1 Tax=Plenodomus tracheiphilus IPT5 TaxID=1408161 RepID=A0A6A7B558_9PLEO|nr:hypothetical protein T440DRAFT_468411 [Plenodomus tracheiphilus IPT5]